MALNAPTPIVEIGFASNPLTSLAATVWTDVTTYCEAFGTKMGRQHELSRIEASTCDLVLDNKDRRFDPTNTSSPYNPNVLPMKRLRIRATWNATTYPVFCGFIESWAPDWPSVGDSQVKVHAVDALGKILSLKNLLDPYGQTVQADAPTAWWRFHETSVAGGALDSGPSGYLGSYQGSPTLGASGPVNDGTNSAVVFNQATGDGILIPAGAAISGTGAFSAAAWVKTTANTYIFRQNTGAGGWSLSLQGTFVFQTYDASATRTLNPAGNYNDGNWHLVKVSRAAGGTLTVVVDGLSIGTFAPAASNITQAPLVIGNTGAPAGWSAAIAEPAIYAATELTTAQSLKHYQAAPAWANDASGTRVGRLLDAIGWPAADRTIEGGVSVFQAEPRLGNVLTQLLDSADSENGLLFQDPAGLMTFFARSHLWTTSASINSQATFGDGAGELPYVLAGIAPVMDDMDLWNDVQAQRSGGVMRQAQDAASQTANGTRTLSVTNMKVSSDNEAAGRAQYDLARYKTPQLRIRSFTVTPLSDPNNLYPQVLGRLLWDLVTFKRRPPGGGPVLSQLSVIEGIAHSYTKADWKTTFALSLPDSNARNYFILDDANRGKLDTGLLAY